MAASFGYTFRCPRYRIIKTKAHLITEMATYLLLELNEPHFYESDNIDARWKVGAMPCLSRIWESIAMMFERILLILKIYFKIVT